MVSIPALTLSALDAPPETPAGFTPTAEEEALATELLRPLTPEEEEDQSEQVLALGQEAAGD